MPQAIMLHILLASLQVADVEVFLVEAILMQSKAKIFARVHVDTPAGREAQKLLK
jgi:hypothetical protein